MFPFGQADPGGGPPGKRPARETWTAIAVIVTVIVGGLAVRFVLGLDDGDERATTEDVATTGTASRIADCYVELGNWFDLLVENAHNSPAQSEIINAIALEYGATSPEFEVITRSANAYISKAYEVGRSAALAEEGALAEFCRATIGAGAEGSSGLTPEPTTRVPSPPPTTAPRSNTGATPPVAPPSGDLTDVDGFTPDHPNACSDPESAACEANMEECYREAAIPDDCGI